MSWLPSWLRPVGRLRELKLFTLCAAFGLAIMPPAIFLVGSAKLGAYANGGLFALWGDYLRGIGALRIPYLLVALGLYLAIMLLRLMRWGWRRLD